MLYAGANRSLLGLGMGRMGSVGGQVSDLQRILALPGMGPLWDFSDMGTMYQDSAGTQPVTAFGQPVGRVLDKIGKWPALIQPTAINRPIYALDANGKPSLSFNGTNQWMQTSGNLDLSGTDKLTVVAGVRKLSPSIGMLTETGASGAGTPGFYVASGIDGGYAGWTSLGRGSAVGATNQITGINSTYPKSAVITVTHDIAASLSKIRENTTAGTDATGDKGTGNFRSQVQYVGTRAGTSIFFNGNIHALCIRASLSTQPEIDLLERFANARAGAF